MWPWQPKELEMQDVTNVAEWILWCSLLRIGTLKKLRWLNHQSYYSLFVNVAYFIGAASPEKSFNVHMHLTMPQPSFQAWFPPSHKVVRLLQHPKSSGRYSKEFAEASSSTRAEKPKKLGSDVRRFFLTLSLSSNEAAWKGAWRPFLSANLFHQTM